MSSTVSDSLHMSGPAFEQRLVSELELNDWRGLIVVVVAEPGLVAAAEAAIQRASDQHGLTPDQVLRYVVSRDASGRERLRAYNRARDTLTKEKRLICLQAGSAADVRFLREVAPDLTATIDVFAELREPARTEADWTVCSQSLRALMQERNATLDFTGLLPASVEQRELPLDQLYQELIEELPVDPLFESIADRGWVVLGHPGSGKTTYVRHLARTYARGQLDPLEIGGKVPLLLSLSDYGEAREQDRVQSLVDFLPAYLAEQNVADPAAILDHLPEVLLLLDGLDELPGVELRRIVWAEIESLLTKRLIGGVVVTGRSFLIEELPSQAQLRVALAQPPSREQMQAFVTTFVRLRGGRAEHASEIIARIERDPDLAVLANTPLMLTFMVILDELEGRLPDRRIEIYYRLGELLVDRWTRARSIGTTGPQRERPTRADAMRVLGPLAWWTLERGGVVTESALLHEIERIEARRESPDEARRRATALVDMLRSDTALLVPLEGGQSWSFVHQSVAEYFAGVEVERDPRRWAALLDDPFRSEWREVLLFCAGQLGVIDGRTDSLDRLISAILKKARRSDPYDANYPSLLMGLLVESPGLSRKQLDLLVARLLKLVFTMAHSIVATYLIQNEFASGFLLGVRGATQAGLAEGMRRLFASERVDWDRVFPFGPNAELRPFELKSTIFAAEIALGPITSSLIEPWVAEFGIDLEPTIEHWSKRDAWVYRFAIWWVRSTPEQRERPFAEIVGEFAQ